MASVTGLTAARMLEIEAESIVGGHIVGDELMLVRFDGVEIDAGNVRGPVGPVGPQGPPFANGVDTVSDQNIDGAKNFIKSLTDVLDVIARNGTGNQVKIGVVGGGAAAGIELGSALDYVGLTGAHVVSVVTNGVAKASIDSVGKTTLTPSGVGLALQIGPATSPYSLTVNPYGSAAAVLASGAEFDGAASTARAGSATMFEFLNAGFNWYANTGLTPGLGYARNRVMNLDATGQIAASGQGHALGLGALGAAGAYLEFDGTATQTFIQAKGTPVNIPLIMRTKGNGGFSFQNGGGGQFASIGSDGGIGATGLAHSLGIGAYGDPGCYLELDGTATETYIQGKGTPANVPLILRAKGTGALIVQTGGGIQLATVDSTGIMAAKGVSNVFGAGAFGADSSGVLVGTLDADYARIAAYQPIRATAALLLESKGAGEIRFRIGSNPATMFMQILATGKIFFTNGGGAISVDGMEIFASPNVGFAIMRLRNNWGAGGGGPFLYMENAAGLVMQVDGTGKLFWGAGAASPTILSTTATAGGVQATPASVVGYLVVNINGTDRKIPYYAV